MTTLRQYLNSTGCDDKLADLIELVAQQAKPIREAFISNQEYVDSENIYGETQIALDKWSNEHLMKIFKESNLVKEAASEEEAEIVKFPDAKTDYALTIDPLDGSSLVQVNLAVGTIVGVYEGSVMQPGVNLRAAFYMLYGPLTVLGLTVKQGVHLFALNEEGDYVMTERDVRIPEGKLYASGALKKDWLPEHARFIKYLEDEGYKLRYSGSFVADVHQYLKYGGLFSYPAYKGKETGKLRLLFEANPMGFIVSEAWGRISNGKKNLLEIKPEKLDHRVPIYVGSRGVIEKMEKEYDI
ncbi:MAG: fructose 1,6-bisphosphatase [Candidatus Altiarchaeales archaeon ex4484_96]|nr:MAG: fructose 1,6-bisphosphatase [Candidatus Altiarchaeales archaeon ex4484_96]